MEGPIRWDKTLNSVDPYINFYIDWSIMSAFHGRKMKEL